MSKKGTIATIIFALFILTINLYIGWQTFVLSQKQKQRQEQRKVVSSKVEIQYEDKNVKQTEKFNKKYQALYRFDENVSVPLAVRYTRKIQVELELSEEELRDNLIHAAWELQKERNAKAVTIFAYRPDDIDFALYSAGKCTLAPFGDWAKAVEKDYNSVENLQPVVEFASIYFKEIPSMLKRQVNVVVNTQNAKLYKDYNINPDEVIAHLPKGLKATIISGKRTFSTDEYLDFYKIQFTTGKNKSAIGWVFGNNIELDKGQFAVPKTQATVKSQSFDEEKYRNTILYKKTILDWKKARQEEKITTCEQFLIVSTAKGYSKLTIVNIENIRDYAKILADTLDTVLKNPLYNLDRENVAYVLTLLANKMNWL